MAPATHPQLPHETEYYKQGYREGYEAGKAALKKELKALITSLADKEAYTTSTATYSIKG